MSHISRRWGASIGSGCASFLFAFAVYEGVLFAATIVLPSGSEAFSLPVVARIFSINLLALGTLFLLHRLAVVVGLLDAEPEPSGVRS